MGTFIRARARVCATAAAPLGACVCVCAGPVCASGGPAYECVVPVCACVCEQARVRVGVRVSGRLALCRGRDAGRLTNAASCPPHLRAPPGPAQGAPAARSEPRSACRRERPHFYRVTDSAGPSRTSSLRPAARFESLMEIPKTFHHLALGSRGCRGCRGCGDHGDRGPGPNEGRLAGRAEGTFFSELKL